MLLLYLFFYLIFCVFIKNSPRTVMGLEIRLSLLITAT